MYLCRAAHAHIFIRAPAPVKPVEPDGEVLHNFRKALQLCLQLLEGDGATAVLVG